MNNQDFKFFEEFLLKESGLLITFEKMYLLESRLLPIAQKNGMHDLRGLAQKMRMTRDPDLQRAVVEAMTTNETSFFRDNSPFQCLKNDLVPLFAKARSAHRRLRVWSAACSSGQEPYSIAMVLREHPALAGWKIEILATDLCRGILAQARSGVYSQFDVQRGLPVHMLVKYFTQQGDKWLARQELRDMVIFKQANLLTDISALGQFDIVFCRNVLIYFGAQTKTEVLARISGVMSQDGALFLGGAESVIGISDCFKPAPETNGVYIRTDSVFTESAKPASAAPSLTTKSAIA